ncbi:hypothetical protein ES705_23396 [subsurface metagenome]
MYCSNCKTNVLTMREEIDICLVIILCIFTAGFGLLIYLAIYYDKKPIHCVHCKATCQPNLSEQTNNHSTLKTNEAKSYQEIKLYKSNEPAIEEHSIFCYNCGVQLSEREGLKFCAFCGTKIN